MKGVAFRFFISGVLCVTLGMAWGIQMAISDDHTMAGAHAHLNLVGWVTLAMFGVYYHLTPQAAAGRLAGVHFLIALAGVVVMVPGIAIVLSGGTMALAAVGSVLTLTSMVIFLVTVLGNGLGPRG